MNLRRHPHWQHPLGPAGTARELSTTAWKTLRSTASSRYTPSKAATPLVISPRAGLVGGMRLVDLSCVPATNLPVDSTVQHGIRTPTGTATALTRPRGYPVHRPNGPRGGSLLQAHHTHVRGKAVATIWYAHTQALKPRSRNTDTLSSSGSWRLRLHLLRGYLSPPPSTVCRLRRHRPRLSLPLARQLMR